MYTYIYSFHGNEVSPIDRIQQGLDILATDVFELPLRKRARIIHVLDVLPWTVLPCILRERSTFWSASGPPLRSLKLPSRGGRGRSQPIRPLGKAMYIHIYIYTYVNVPLVQSN